MREYLCIPYFAIQKKGNYSVSTRFFRGLKRRYSLQKEIMNI